MTTDARAAIAIHTDLLDLAREFDAIASDHDTVTDMAEGRPIAPRRSRGLASRAARRAEARA